MDKNTVYIGLDYHQQSVQVCAVSAEGRVLRNRSVGNSVLEVTQVASGLGEVKRVLIEACCGAADLAEDLRREASWPVELAHAGYVSRMKGSPDKTDYGDARLLAELGRTGFVPRVWLAPLCVRELRSLTRYRQQLVNERRKAKVRLLAVLRENRVRAPVEAGARWTRRWLAWLPKAEGLAEHARWIIERHLEDIARLADDIKSAERRLAQATRDDPIVSRLMEQPGIGAITAWMLRAQVGWFDRFKNGKQLARYCGLTPCNASSGARRADAGMIRVGDPSLKAALIEAAHRLVRLDERWRDLAFKLRRRGKTGSVVAVAIANRWVRGLFHQMKEVKAPESVAA